MGCDICVGVEGDESNGEDKEYQEKVQASSTFLLDSCVTIDGGVQHTGRKRCWQEKTSSPHGGCKGSTTRA